MDWSGLAGFAQRLFGFDPNSPLLFTQFYFWAFFALVYAVFALIGDRRLLRNSFLFFVSLFFYYKTSGLSVLILIFVTCSDFFIARRIASATHAGHKKAWLVLSVCIDLLLLCYFKYAYFFADFVHSLTGLELRVVNVFGVVGNALVGGAPFSVDRIVLPVGISFFIFQVISYTVDVYRGDVKPVGNILDFGFYVSFFPQLVAGPIVRASEFIPQLYKPFFLGRKQFGIAVFWILNGLAKKLILSDYIAVNFVDRVFGNPLLFTGFENLAALFGYSLQVYADFSGYTDIAIGVAMLMGFYLPQNFNSPYKASNPQDFWRRWHMSLSRWLRNYLYIPLGGNRNASAGTYIIIGAIAVIGSFLSGSWWVAVGVLALAGGIGLWAWLKPGDRKLITTNINSMNTMLLGGLWHGASWNFMIWGGLNGVGMVIYKIWTKRAMWVKLVIIGSVTLLCGTLSLTLHYPVWNMFFVWTLIILAGTVVKALSKCWPGWLDNSWDIFQTFVFITFTRLFFRSGSNLDPALANEEAWNTAQNMVNQIGSPWDLSLIPDMTIAHWPVLLLFVVGMIIHWLPERFKRWYRLNFALLPLFWMALAVVLIIVFIFQFITADLQSFIYFQF